MKLTTVVVPNYNGIEYLKKCLDTLAVSQGTEFDVIVVDNGSSDGSVEEIRANYSDVELISLEENTGFAYAVNRGIEKATTKYVLLLNNDIEVEKEFVKTLESAIEADERLFSVNSRMMAMHDRTLLDGTGDYYCALGWAYAYKKGKKAINSRTKSTRIFSACGGASIYRRDVLEKIGLFDEEHFCYLEDVDVGYRARINGYINSYEPSAVCYHAGSASSGSQYNAFKIELAARNSVYLIYKNMPFLQWLINLPFFIIGFGIKTLFFIKKGFGGLYVKSLFSGIRLSFSDKGRKNKVHFKFKNILNYIIIQIELWINIFRRFMA